MFNKRTKKKLLGGAYRRGMTYHSGYIEKGKNPFENDIYQGIYRGDHGDIDLIKQVLYDEEQKNPRLFETNDIYLDFLFSLIAKAFPIRIRVFSFFWNLITNKKVNKGKNIILEKDYLSYTQNFRISYNGKQITGNILFICIACKKIYYAEYLLKNFIKNKVDFSLVGNINGEDIDLFNLLSIYSNDKQTDIVISKLIVNFIKELIKIGFDINKVIVGELNCIELAIMRNNKYILKELKPYINMSYFNKNTLYGCKKVDYLFTAFQFSNKEVFNIILSLAEERHFFKKYIVNDEQTKIDIVQFLLLYYRINDIHKFRKFFDLFNKILSRGHERYLRKVFKENISFMRDNIRIVISLLLNYEKFDNMDLFLDFCFDEFVDIGITIDVYQLFSDLDIIPITNPQTDFIGIMALANIYGGFKYLVNKGASLNFFNLSFSPEVLNIFGLIFNLKIRDNFFFEKSFKNVVKDYNNFDIIKLIAEKTQGNLGLGLNQMVVQHIYSNLPQQLASQFNGVPISSDIIDLVELLGNEDFANLLMSYNIEPSYNNELHTPVPRFQETPPINELPEYQFYASPRQMEPLQEQPQQNIPSNNSWENIPSNNSWENVPSNSWEEVENNVPSNNSQQNVENNVHPQFVFGKSRSSKNKKTKKTKKTKKNYIYI